MGGDAAAVVAGGIHRRIGRDGRWHTGMGGDAAGGRRRLAYARKQRFSHPFSLNRDHDLTSSCIHPPTKHCLFLLLTHARALRIFYAPPAAIRLPARSSTTGKWSSRASPRVRWPPWPHHLPTRTTIAAGPAHPRPLAAALPHRAAAGPTRPPSLPHRRRSRTPAPPPPCSRAPALPHRAAAGPACPRPLAAPPPPCSRAPALPRRAAAAVLPRALAPSPRRRRPCAPSPHRRRPRALAATMKTAKCWALLPARAGKLDGWYKKEVKVRCALLMQRHLPRRRQPDPSRGRPRRPNISVWKMLKRKRSTQRNRRIDDATRNTKKTKRTYCTRSSTKSKTICNRETTELLISGDLHVESNQGAWSEPSEEFASKLSESVVSLSLSNGHTVLFRCSGVGILCEGYASRILTSASLVKALNDKRKDHGNLKVEVHHGDCTTTGFLGEFDLDCNIATVNVRTPPNLRAVHLRLYGEFPPDCNVVAVGRDISGKLITTSGKLNCDLSGHLPSLMTTTCKISEVSEGGPLVDFDGNFLGVNLTRSTEGTLFVSEDGIIGQFCEFLIFLEDIEFPMSVSAGESSNGEMPNSDQEVHQDVLNEYQSGDLESLGYPEPPKSILNGEKRFFACTGSLIEWNGGTTILTAASLIRDSCIKNKIVENLRIEVLFPNKMVAEGTLQHYNLHYNIALVSVNYSCASQPVKLPDPGWPVDGQLLAVGYIFKSRKLMAARGYPISVISTHDCQSLFYTTCEITKAGIGGPLFYFDGKFLGMNFYHEYSGGSPFLPWSKILQVLESFKTKKTVADVGHDDYASCVVDWTLAGNRRDELNSWSVPLPFWCHKDLLKRYRRPPIPATRDWGLWE
ncbi:hypothetical protein U9M48_016460 [Paspalum notatum var. saurae]|uniref:Uncharacterized protein n=1 Tax=Paspalum notatum var. saurae TaxID=547442 RepID=A0AAQ3T5Q0_PASNO